MQAGASDDKILQVPTWRESSLFSPVERDALEYAERILAQSAELEARVSTLPPNSAVYYLLVSRDGNGENVHPLEYAERPAAHPLGGAARVVTGDASMWARRAVYRLGGLPILVQEVFLPELGRCAGSTTGVFP